MQHRTTLFTFVAKGPRATVQVVDDGGVRGRDGEAPHVETMTVQGTIDQVAMELHVARVKRDQQRGTPPAAKDVVVRTRNAKRAIRRGLHCFTHDGA